MNWGVQWMLNIYPYLCISILISISNIFKGLDPCKVLRMTSLWCLPPVACSVAANVIPSVLQWKHNLMTLTPANFYHQYHFHAIKMYGRKWWSIALHLFWPWMSMKWPNGGPLLTTEQYWWPPSWSKIALVSV